MGEAQLKADLSRAGAEVSRLKQVIRDIDEPSLRALIVAKDDEIASLKKRIDELSIPRDAKIITVDRVTEKEVYVDNPALIDQIRRLQAQVRNMQCRSS